MLESYIKFDEYDMLELFESESTAGADERGFYRYNKTDKRGVNCLLSMSIYENKCRFSLSLEHDGRETSITSYEFNRVNRLERRESTLLVHIEDEEKPFAIEFKPYFIMNSTHG